jgi:predicted oxidoreductase (fatty acid repression mutant protein)
MKITIVTVIIHFVHKVPSAFLQETGRVTVWLQSPTQGFERRKKNVQVIIEKEKWGEGEKRSRRKRDLVS